VRAVHVKAKDTKGTAMERPAERWLVCRACPGKPV